MESYGRMYKQFVMALFCGFTIRRKRDVFVCSSVTIACIVSSSYSSLEWFIDPAFPSTPAGPRPADSYGRPSSGLASGVNEMKDSAAKHIICHTNDGGILRKFRHKTLTFMGKLHNDSFVYLSGNTQIVAELDDHLSSTPCGYFYDDFCCLYSPHFKENVAQNFSFEKDYITDPYFHIEDIFYGKAQHVEQRVQFSYVTMEQETITITAEHRCRSDIALDPYPEVHIKVYSRAPRNGASEAMFHWYL